MPLFSEQKYNSYVPQYVGAPLEEYLGAASAVQKRYDDTAQGYSLINELADTLETSPLENDKKYKAELVTKVNSAIEAAAKQGNFDQLQNEMRYLARQYAKESAPIKENAARFQAEQKRILDAKLPSNQENYLLNKLTSQPGLSFDENRNPKYIQPLTFAEFFDTQKALNEFGTGYKENMISSGYTLDPSGKFYNSVTNEYIDPKEVINAMSNRLNSDEKAKDFIVQDLVSKGINPSEKQPSLLNPKTQVTAYENELTRQSLAQAEKLGFSKERIESRDNEEYNIKLRKQIEEENPGYTFDMYFGVPAKAGVASPSDLRNTASQLEINKSDLNDEITRWRNTVERSLGKITTKQVNGKTRYYAGTTDITEEYDLYNDRLDGIEAQKWELNEIESQAKLDAGLPPNYTPNQKVLDEAQAAYDLHMQNSSAAYTKSGFDQGTLEERQRGAQYAYNKVIDNSNDANLRAYRAALAKNAKDRTDVRGVTTFSKAVRPEMDRIGNQLIASTSGILKARDIATGKELTDLEDYGTAVENIGWDINKGELELVYKTGEKNKSGDFVPSNKTVSITAPPELVTQLVKKGIVDPVDLEISKQIGDFGGKVKLGNFDATIEIKRNAQTGPIPYVVTVETDQGPYRVAFSSKGKAIKFINQAAKTYNGN